MTDPAGTCQNQSAFLMANSLLPGTNCTCHMAATLAAFSIECHYDEACQPGCAGQYCIDRVEVFYFSSTANTVNAQPQWRQVARDFSNQYRGDGVQWQTRFIRSNFANASCQAHWVPTTSSSNPQQQQVDCQACLPCPGSSETVTDCRNIQEQAVEPGCGLGTPPVNEFNPCIQGTPAASTSGVGVRPPTALMGPLLLLLLVMLGVSWC